MSINDFGIRVDSIELLNSILNNTYIPKNSVDLHIYAEMKKWTDCFETPEFNFIYFGSEFCNKLIPSIEEWKTIANFCLQHNKTLVMVVPPMDVRSEKVIMKIIHLLITHYTSLKLEIEVNDFGVLEQLNQVHTMGDFTVRLGRILDKTFHDSRLDDEDLSEIFNGCQMKWSDDLQWLSSMSKRVLLKYNVLGADFDIPTISSMCMCKAKDDAFSIGIFVPYSYCTTGGLCQMQNIDIPSKNKFDIRDINCAHNCRKYYEVMKMKNNGHTSANNINSTKNTEIISYRLGNTVFYLRNVAPETIIDADCIERLIFEPKLII